MRRCLPAPHANTLGVVSDEVSSRGTVLVPEQMPYEIANANRSRRVAIRSIDAGGAMTPFHDAVTTSDPAHRAA